MDVYKPDYTYGCFSVLIILERRHHQVDTYKPNYTLGRHEKQSGSSRETSPIIDCNIRFPREEKHMWNADMATKLPPEGVTINASILSILEQAVPAADLLLRLFI